MHLKNGTKKMAAVFASLLLTITFGLANGSAIAQEETSPENITVQVVETVIGDHYIRYPQLVGMADEAVQQAINDRIVEQAKISQRMVTLATLTPGGTGLDVDTQSYLGGGIFSAMISAKGVMENGRSGHEYTALCVELATGEPVTLDELFSDPESAVSMMETTLETTYLDELSSYLTNSNLTPLPTDSFTLDADGITFYYPYRQFAMLSEYSGAVQFTYDELAAYLRTDPEGLPARLQVLPANRTDAEIQQAVKQAVSDGVLPHIPVALGDEMTDVVALYRLLREPDQYPGGRYYQLEAPMFREVLVLSDAIASGYEHSKVLGLQTRRTNLFGIQTGVTFRPEWLSILGEPDTTVAFDENLAYSYGYPAGTADYYQYGNYRLQLYADADELLYAITLTE